MTDLINTALEQSVDRFAALTPRNAVLINSAPKAGTHLLRNIVAHFAGLNCREQFVMYDDILATFPLKNKEIVVGHVPFCAQAILATRDLPQILLIRDPADLLVALGRAAFDVNNSRPDYIFARNNLTLHEYMTMLATGYNLEGIEVGPYSRFLHEFMMGWFNRDYFLVDFSEIQFLKQDLLEDILDFCGLDLPRDWRKRLAAGMDPALSATYIAPLPPEERAQARAFAEALLDFHVPGAVSWYQNTRETIARRRARDGSGRARGTEELQRPPA